MWQNGVYLLNGNGEFSDKYSTMPTASIGLVGKIVQYTGTTGGGYTNGYFYKGIATNIPSVATIGIGESTGITEASIVKATFEGLITTSGTYNFIFDGTDWTYDGNVVTLSDFGISVVGTPDNLDVVVIEYTASSFAYSWDRVDVQPNRPIVVTDLVSTTKALDVAENTIYKLGTLTALTLTTVETSDLESIIYFTTDTSISFTDSALSGKWIGMAGSPTLAVSTEYVISICNGIGVVAKVGA